MQLQPGVFPIEPEDYPRVVDVWEASARATHHFVREADIDVFRPMVRDALPQLTQLACVRDVDGHVAGFIAAAHRRVDMLFLHPMARGQGAGRRLLSHALVAWGATELDVNEQNEQAVGFYLHMGFRVVGRSELDGTGKPYPLLHLKVGGDGQSPASELLDNGDEPV